MTITADDEHAAADADYAAQQTVPQPTPVREEPDTTACCTAQLLCPIHDLPFHPGAY